MDEFTHAGTWYLPSLPSNTVGGTLSFNPQNGARLDLTGDFFVPVEHISSIEGVWTQSVGMFSEINVVWGHTEHGRAATLFNCRALTRLRAIGHDGATFQVGIVMIGCHFKSLDDAVFNYVRLRLVNLPLWFGFSASNYEVQHTFESDHTKWTTTYRMTKAVTIELETFSLTFLSGFDRNRSNNTIPTYFVELIPQAPLPFVELEAKLIRPLQDFLSLATDKASTPIAIDTRSESCVPDGGTILTPIHLYFVAKGANIKYEEPRFLQNIPFSYEVVKENLNLYLSNWYRKIEWLRTAIDLYTGLYYLPSVYSHLEFLTLSQAIETYHRRKFDGKYMPPEKYQKVFQKLLDAVPDELEDSHRQSLISRLRFANEYSLRKRITLILRENLAVYQSIVDALVGNKALFVSRLVDTRNYLTHYSEEPGEHTIFDEAEQKNFAEQMKLVLQLCFYSEIGFDATLVNDAMKDDWRFQKFTKSQSK
ncbi:MAG: hypothetical protein KF726_11505 [Anaerolineae bacterium]|nr:hypothetical protein [Anaerolineae bacterium]